MSQETYSTNNNSNIYYNGIFWNDFDYVRESLNERISGQRDIDWAHHFQKSYSRKFKKALILNCGNGWVERYLYDIGALITRKL